MSAKADNYRGSVAILAEQLTTQQLIALKNSRKIIYTERGSEQLSIPVSNLSQVTDELNKCIASRR